MKYCARCGQQNDDSAVFCARCGNSLSAPAGQGSSTVVVVGNSGQQATGSNPGTLWLILNIVLVALSCCSNILGIIGIIFAAIAMGDFNKGMYNEAKSHANVAKWMFWISIIVGVVGGVIALVAGLLPAAIALIGGIIASASGGLY
jgi:hypothetical protein